MRNLVWNAGIRGTIEQRGLCYLPGQKKKVLISSAMKSEVRTHLPLSVQRVCAD